MSVPINSSAEALLLRRGPLAGRRGVAVGVVRAIAVEQAIERAKLRKDLGIGETQRLLAAKNFKATGRAGDGSYRITRYTR
jgi:hypothetical protein